MALPSGYNSASFLDENGNVKFAGLDSASQPVQTQPSLQDAKTAAAKGAMASMNAGGSAGQTLTSAGLMATMTGKSGALGPAGIGAGLALTAYEQSKQAEANNERARIQEEQDRKAAVQTALNQALGATRQLGV